MLRQITFFQSILGSKAMHWNFQSVKCMDKLVEHNDGKKEGSKSRIPGMGLKRMSMPAEWRKLFLKCQLPLPVHT